MSEQAQAVDYRTMWERATEVAGRLSDQLADAAQVANRAEKDAAELRAQLTEMSARYKQLHALQSETARRAAIAEACATELQRRLDEAERREAGRRLRRCSRCDHVADVLYVKGQLGVRQAEHGLGICPACSLADQLAAALQDAERERVEAAQACTRMLADEKKQREKAEARVRYLERRLRVVQLAADPAKPMHVMAADDGDKPVNDR